MYEIFKKNSNKGKKQKEPKSSFTITKKANRLVLIVGCALFGLSLIGAIRANVMAGNVIRLSQQLETINKDVKKIKEKKRVYDSSALSFYVRNFVNEYINFNGKATDEEKKARDEKLASYFSGDLALDKGTDNAAKDLIRKLLQVSVTRVEESEELLLAYTS